MYCNKIRLNVAKMKDVFRFTFMHHFCAVYQDEDAIKTCLVFLHYAQKREGKLVLFVDSKVNKEAMITLKAQRL